MRSFLLTSLLAGAAIAAPTPQNLPFGGSSNDVAQGKCKPVTLIFARGSIEGGNMGMIVGPGFADGLGKIYPNQVAVQGVDYPADIVGAVTGAVMSVGAEGSRKMADLTKKALSTCAGTKVVLSGYSQGAEQVRGALSLLGGDAGKVSAVVTFGDPMQMLPFTGIPQNKGKVICASDDPVCLGGINIAAHLAYGTTSVGPAVDFVKQALGSIGSSTTSSTAPASSSAPAAASGLAGLFGGFKLPTLPKIGS